MSRKPIILIMTRKPVAEVISVIKREVDMLKDYYFIVEPTTDTEYIKMLKYSALSAKDQRAVKNFSKKYLT